MSIALDPLCVLDESYTLKVHVLQSQSKCGTLPQDVGQGIKMLHKEGHLVILLPFKLMRKFNR